MTDRIKNFYPLITLFSLLGLLLSLVSLYQHAGVHYGFIEGSSFCDFSQKISCLNVHKSRYSYLLGIPIPSLAVFFYGALTIFALASTGGKWIEEKATISIFFILSLFSLLFSAYLFSLSYLVIKVICPTCIGMYLVNLCLFFTSYIFGRKVISGSLISSGIKELFLAFTKSTTTQGLFVVIGLFLGFIFSCTAPSLLGAIFRPDSTQILIRQFNKEEEHSFTVSSEGVNKDYGIGNPEAKIKIIEYADYECPACRAFAPVLESIMDRYKDKVFFVKKIFPLDNDCNPMIPKPFHKHSCFATRFAYCSGEQGKFSEMHKRLMELPDIEAELPNEKVQEAIMALGEEASVDMVEVRKCMQEKRYDQKVLKDISEAEKAGLQGTPTVYVNGKIVKDIQMLEPLIQSLLK